MTREPEWAALRKDWAVEELPMTSGCAAIIELAKDPSRWGGADLADVDVRLGTSDRMYGVCRNDVFPCLVYVRPMPTPVEFEALVVHELAHAFIARTDKHHDHGPLWRQGTLAACYNTYKIDLEDCPLDSLGKFALWALEDHRAKS